MIVDASGGAVYSDWWPAFTDELSDPTECGLANDCHKELTQTIEVINCHLCPHEVYCDCSDPTLWQTYAIALED